LNEINRFGEAEPRCRRQGRSVSTPASGFAIRESHAFARIWLFPGQGKAQQQTRTFGTATGAVLEMADWLSEQGVTHAAMESTRVY
jgi:hypothetical protein